MSDLHIGQVFSRTRTLNQSDFDLFAKLSGDDNPIHVDPVFAAATSFGATVSHGVLLCAILRQLAQEIRPGTTQNNQFVTYPAPTFAGQAMRFFLEVAALDGETVTLKGGCERVRDGQMTCIYSTVLGPMSGATR